MLEISAKNINENIFLFVNIQLQMRNCRGYFYTLCRNHMKFHFLNNLKECRIIARLLTSPKMTEISLNPEKIVKMNFMSVPLTPQQLGDTRYTFCNTFDTIYIFISTYIAYNLLISDSSLFMRKNPN